MRLRRIIYILRRSRLGDGTRLKSFIRRGRLSFLARNRVVVIIQCQLLLETAYILNLRGSDIPYNPLFHAYLFVGLEFAVFKLFVENSKIQEDVGEYLKENGVQLRSYTDLWPFLRRREWGEGKVRFHSFCYWKPFFCVNLTLTKNLNNEGSDCTSNFICDLAYVDAFPVYVGAFLY